MLSPVKKNHPDKVAVQVYDYVDSSVPMLAQVHEKRMKRFKAMGHEQAPA